MIHFLFSQEVREDYYDSSLYPDMVKSGYDGKIMVDEQTGTRTGQATFWKQVTKGKFFETDPGL